jgi:hypothetical protein
MKKIIKFLTEPSVTSFGDLVRPLGEILVSVFY